MKKFFRRAILFNPAALIRRFIRGIRTGEFFWDFYYAIKFYTMPTVGTIKTDYYAKDRWPKWDFKNHPPEPAQYQIVRKQQTETKKSLEAIL